MKHACLVLACLCWSLCSFATPEKYTLFSESSTACLVLTTTPDPVRPAARMLCADVEAVFGHSPMLVEGATLPKHVRPDIVAGIPGTHPFLDRLLKKHRIDTRELDGAWEAFRLEVVSDGKRNLLLVLGSDPLGLAYGLLEISRIIGVSPWIWWADAVPARLISFSLPVGYRLEDKPSVPYRGIFLNDEDFGLMPWATKTLDPASAKGAIGPTAYERIFQLLLRLRANTLWPAMHECTAAFYTVPGNAEMAARYGIHLGTSHCEPLMRNNAGEWDSRSMGPYDYTRNAEKVKAYWTERVVRTNRTPCLYTVGMRGVHDGKMEGARTIEEQKNLLEKVFDDQRRILSENLHRPATDIPQVFIPYKEVLDVYDAGLKVPDDVTLMWCDDNYGYLTRFSSADEQRRSGGAGIYYHLSYWGRPHDYLWLGTTSPALMRLELTRAWEHGMRKIWVANVGDIKPGEYLTEYFLDLAWNMGKPEPDVRTLQFQPLWANHLQAFMGREFGPNLAPAMSQLMQAHYRLANQRKPEFMGWSRVEEPGYPNGRSPVVDTEFSDEEALERIEAYATIEHEARTLGEKLEGRQREAYFQLVLYPVAGASQLNQKLLYAQLARHADRAGRPAQAQRYAAASLFAYEEIHRLTAVYDKDLGQGKWALLMNDHPRDLLVFAAPTLPERLRHVVPVPIHSPSAVLRSAVEPSSVPVERDSCVAFPASIALNGERPSGLGHSGSAVRLRKGQSLQYRFITRTTGTAELRIHTLPNHAVDGGSLRYRVEIDQGEVLLFDTRTKGRSEAWKQRVLRNQSVMKASIAMKDPGAHTLRITAMDDDVVLDQCCLDFRKARPGYLVPGTNLKP